MLDCLVPLASPRTVPVVCRRSMTRSAFSLPLKHSRNDMILFNCLKSSLQMDSAHQRKGQEPRSLAEAGAPTRYSVNGVPGSSLASSSRWGTFWMNIPVPVTVPAQDLLRTSGPQDRSADPTPHPTDPLTTEPQNGNRRKKPRHDGDE